MHPTSTRYKFSLLILSPLALAYILYRAFKDGGWRYFKQRLGFGYSKFEADPIHFHCASVGEFITAKSLIFAMHDKYPDKKILITTNTPTAASLVRSLENKNITHHYFPIDLAISINHFLKYAHPICSIILETEIWPNYYYLARKKGTQLAIINARLSNKTLQANSFIKKEYANTLKNVELLLTRSEDDYEKYKSLCPTLKTGHVVGNLKYSIDNKNIELACTTIKRPFFLAASTHENEEIQIAEHIKLLRRKNYLLILAPRYPDRCKSISQQLKNMGLNVSLRSAHDSITNDTDVYLADTLGELNMFFNESALAFVGGSLIPRGGHNILEPAKFGKCIIVGPHTDNFTLEVEDFLQHDAIIQVKNNHELGLQLIKLLKDDKLREKYGKNAMQFMHQQSDILNSYLELLQPILE